jgi:hypothetical protein
MFFLPFLFYVAYKGWETKGGVQRVLLGFSEMAGNFTIIIVVFSILVLMLKRDKKQ